jgi:hypothetical protein
MHALVFFHICCLSLELCTLIYDHVKYSVLKGYLQRDLQGMLEFLLKLSLVHVTGLVRVILIFWVRIN